MKGTKTMLTVRQFNVPVYRGCQVGSKDEMREKKLKAATEKQINDNRRVKKAR